MSGSMLGAMEHVVILCGSLSKHPVNLGAAMHNAGYKALGLNFVYVPFAVSDDLAGAIAGMRALGIRGFGISMPFKVDVIPLLDRLDPLASQIGAVNTIVNDGGELCGHNTDAWGVSRALQEAMSLRGRSALIIGAGGAARAVAFSLVRVGMRLHIVNRTEARAHSLADALSQPDRVSSGSLASISAHRDVDAFINCSSATMQEFGGRSPVPDGLLTKRHVVMDIVYKPVQTALLRQAQRAGAKTLHGGRMLLHQAARQFELYTGRGAPLSAMDEALQQAVAVQPAPQSSG